MSGLAGCAAIFAGSLAAWLWTMPAQWRRRLSACDGADGIDPLGRPHAQTDKLRRDEQAQSSLVIAMLRVAITQGASLPHALSAVGEATGGDMGERLKDIGESLRRGTRWRDAWAPHLNAMTRGENVPAASAEASARAFALLEDTLEPTWSHGSSPVGRLDLAGEQLDRRRRSAIEQAAGKLSVRLLVPMGLCFLPSFVFIGVIPAIASFVA